MKRAVYFLATVWALAGSTVAQSEEIILRVAHFAPPVSTAQKQVLEPWCERLKSQSGGRVKCQIYPSMQLGGTPPQLVDQVKNGVADIVWTAPGFSAGRFPTIEALELPFLATDPRSANKLAWEFYTKHAYKDFDQFKVLAVQLDSAMLHVKDKEVHGLNDLKSLKIRAAHRMGAKTVSSWGAVPVTMPVPQVVESLSKGVMDGTLSSWEQIHANKIDEVARVHVLPPEGRPLYSGTVLTVLMNKQKFAALPADIQAIIDKNSGQALSDSFGQVWDDAVKANIDFVRKQGNTLITLPLKDYDALVAASRDVDDQWIKDVAAKSVDGTTLVKDVRQIAQQYVK